MEKTEIDTVSTYSEGSDLSFASDYRPHESHRRRKGLRRKRCKYQNISNELRATLIKFVAEENQKIKPTAKALGINYSTAKSILQIYRKEGRTEKKLLFKPTGAEDENPDESEKNPILRKLKARVSESSTEIASTAPNSVDKSRYPLRRTSVPVQSDTAELTKPDHQRYEPKMTKKVKKDESEAAGAPVNSPHGGRSPLSFDSEGLIRNNSNDERFALRTSQPLLQENNHTSSIPVYKNIELLPENFLHNKHEITQTLMGSNPIKIPAVTYSSPMGSLFNNYLYSQVPHNVTPRGSDNSQMNMYASLSNLLRQQLHLQTSNLLLLASQNPSLRQQILNQNLFTPTANMPSGAFPLNFHMKM